VIVIPFKSVGNLFFSDSRQEIRRKINERFDSGAHEFGSLTELYDYFEEVDITVIYDKLGNVDAFTFHVYAQSPILNGVSLLTERFVDLVKMFSELDPELESDVGEFTSNKYGVGAHTDYSKEREIACADSVVIFKKGYYDKLKK
jgi:hypothetical protein